MVNYGGDEVAAIVIDIGSSSLRAGYAGDDTPKAVIPTTYGYLPAEGNQDIAMAEGTAPPKKFSKLFLGQNGPSLWRERMEVDNPIQEGLIHDFDPISPLINHAVTDVLRCDPSEHLALVTEPAWNTPENRERMAEIMFEEFQSPAFYIANTGVLNAFAAGKGSALVVDVGHTMASVVPVVDGFVLRKGITKSPLPKFVRAHAHHMLVSAFPSRPSIQLLSHQLIANKLPVPPNAPPQFTLREDRVPSTTQSWNAWCEERETEEWIQSVCKVLDQGWNDQIAMQQPPKQYEFPTGYNGYFGSERLAISEEFFFHNSNLVASNTNLPKTMPHLISESLRNCDADLREVLLSNVVLTGGTSMFSGFADRLGTELVRNFTHPKIYAPGNPIERRYGGWLGGSILASLGTFHQLWISKEEWMEHGKPIVAQRCK